MNQEHFKMAGIVNEHLYFANDPHLFLHCCRVYGIKLKEGSDDVEVFDPSESFGVKPHHAELLDLTVTTAWICKEEPVNGEYNGLERWQLILDSEIEILYEQTGNHIYN